MYSTTKIPRLATHIRYAAIGFSSMIVDPDTKDYLTNKVVAKRFNVSTRTVLRALNWFFSKRNYFLDSCYSYGSKD